MPTIEKRLQALEQENAVRKKTEELLTLAVRGLASKEAFEKLQEMVEETNKKNDKLFDVLIAHNEFTNARCADLQEQITNLDGKVVGLQTEMRQRFAELDGKTAELDGKITALKTEMHERFTEHTTMLQQILGRLPERP